MEDADVTLNDEGQQYGNLDEASAVARTPHKCLVIWCGDHKQTPGGLRKTDEAKAFRRKLLRRPIALRGNTEYVQPNMLGKVVLRYLEDVDDPIVNEIRKMVGETIGSTQPLSQRSVATLRTVCQEVGCAFHEGLCIPVCCTALSVLWLALHKEKFPLLADTLLAAAGVAGKQRWALILPSSARVSMVTYTTVIAVRYPELDHVQNDITCLAIYLLGAQSTHGGFLPVFWDAPSAYMHAATDICGVREENRTVEVFLKENSIDEGPDDSAFLDSLRRSLNTTRGVYPPAALAEIYCEDSRPLTRIRRLHLIVVDLDRSRNVSKRVYGQFQEVHLSAELDECFNTLPVPITDPECPYRCRYVYGYGIDGSDRPSYVLWPRRVATSGWWTLGPAGFLTRQRLISWRQLGWSTFLMLLP